MQAKASTAPPQLEMISHFSHPRHKLRFDRTQAPFNCHGCKEVGIGSRYKCSSSSCNFHLHLHCALPSPSLSHPFYPKCSFRFLPRPPSLIPRYCNACEKDATGFLYHCNTCGFDLHPCCAKLPIVLDDGEVKLFLQHKASVPCHRCGQQGRSWSYRSECKRYNLHVACVREMLVESWQHLYSGDAIAGRNAKLIDLEMTKTPGLKNMLASAHDQKKSKGTAGKCCEMAALALQFVISALLGDPTALVAGVIGTLMAR